MKKETRKALQSYNFEKTRLLEEKGRFAALMEFKNSLSEKTPDDELIVEINAEIKEMQRSITETEKYLETIKPEIVSYIKTIPDIIARTAASLFYLNGLSWQEVAQIIKYGDETPDSIRARVYRYARKTDA